MLNNNIEKGLLALDDKNYSMAINHFNNVIAKNILDECAYLNRGLAFKYLNENQNALKDFKNVIKLNTKNYKAFYYISEIYLSKYIENIDNKNFLSLALNNNNSSISLNKEYYPAYEVRSRIYFEMGEHKKAYKLSKSLFDANPKLSDAYKVMLESQNMLIDEFDQKQSQKDYYIYSAIIILTILIVLIASIIFVVNYWRWI